MPSIREHSDFVPLVNVSTVTPETQQDFIDAWTASVDAFISRQPGFMSAGLHKSLDGLPS